MAAGIDKQDLKQIAALLLDLLNDRLTPAVKREFARHLHVCPDCFRFLNTYKNGGDDGHLADCRDSARDAAQYFAISAQPGAQRGRQDRRLFQMT